MNCFLILLITDIAYEILGNTFCLNVEQNASKNSFIPHCTNKGDSLESSLPNWYQFVKCIIDYTELYVFDVLPFYCTITFFRLLTKLYNLLIDLLNHTQNFSPEMNFLPGNPSLNLPLQGRLPLDKLYFAKRLFLLFHGLYGETDEKIIQFIQRNVDSRDKICLVENGLQ